MAGCVLLSGIPRQVRRPTLQKHFLSAEIGGGQIEYILHPLGNDLAKAVIKFTDDKTASSVLQHDHLIEGCVINIAPMPRQVLSRCTATVDPTIMAGLPDLVACMDLLRNDFGVTVHYDPLEHVMSMTGSFLQLQFAQAALSAIFREQEEIRQRALTEAAEKGLHVSMSSVPLPQRCQSAPRVLEAHDRLSKNGQPPIKTPNEKPASPRHSSRSSVSSGGWMASGFAESPGLHCSGGSQFKPYKSSIADSDSAPRQLEESQSSKNARTVDDMFAATMLTAGTGPKPSESIHSDRLSESDELLNTWGLTGNSSTKVVVEFDTQVFNFMRRIHGQSLKDLERSYRVQLQYKKNGDVTSVRILPFGDQDEEIAAIHQAKNPLINLYHTVFKNVIKIVVSLEKIPLHIKSKVDSVVAKIKESFKDTLYMDTKDIRKRLTLVGQKKHVDSAEEKLRKALGLKKDSDIIKPKMVFMMQSPKTTVELAQNEANISSFFKISSRSEVEIQSSLDMDDVHVGPTFDDSDSRTLRQLRKDGIADSSIMNSSADTSLTKSLTSRKRDIGVAHSAGRQESPRSNKASRSNEVRSPRTSITSPKPSGSTRGTPVGDGLSPRSLAGRQADLNLSSRSEGAFSDLSHTSSRRSSQGSLRGTGDVVKDAGTLVTNSFSDKFKAVSTFEAPNRLLSPPPQESVFSPRFAENRRRPSDVVQAPREDLLVSSQTRVAWPTPEPSGASEALGQQGSSSIQHSVQTSMTGVTPLSSSNLSGTGSFPNISYDTVNDSTQSLRLSQSLAVSQSFGTSQPFTVESQGSSNMRITSGSILDRISFMSDENFQTRHSAQKLSPAFKFATKEGIKVSVYSGKITEAAVDAVICPSNEELRLLHGIALDISCAAGHDLQEACTSRVVEKGNVKITESFAVAASGTLACQYVVLAVCPMWCLHPEKVECEGLLKQTLLNAFLSTDERLKVESIALPAVGTGEHGIPPDVCGWAMLAAIEEFSSTSLGRNLKEISIINSEEKITKIIGDTLEEVLLERASNQITPLLSPHTSRPVSISQDVPYIVHVIAACVSIAERSGSIIRDIMEKGELGIVEKGINDLQTEADRSAERCIVASLHAQFPGLSVVGEEGTSSVEAADVNPDWLEMSQSDAVLAKIQDVNEDLQDLVAEDVVVWVDPLDGTSEYTQGLVEHVTTLIGIAVRGRAIAGVIHQPFYTERQGAFDAQYGRSVWGMVGVGAFGYSQNQGPEGKGNNVIVTTRSHGTGAVGEAVDACKPSDVIRAGGCGHKVLMVLEGRAHAYVFASPGCKKWDTAAPEAILQAVGGMLTDIHGNSLSYHANVQTRNSAGIIATPAGVDHKWYIDHIPEDIKMSLPEVMEANQLADPRHSLNKMQDQQPFIVKLLAACVTIAKRSGSIIREIMKEGELGIVEKGINDLQTEADRSAERCIVASLHAQFPGLTVVGEEGTSSVEAADVSPDWLEMSKSDAVLTKIQDVNEDLQDIVSEDVVVWVDPLDGTSEYTQGLVDHVTTLIGIAVRGRAIAGVIHQPFYTERQGAFDAQYGRAVWGMIGVGTFGYSQNQGPEGKGNNVIVTTRSHGTGAVGEAVDACKPSDVIRAGGCGHKVLMVLEGRAHAYVFASPGCKKWDTAAPEAILQAVGGMLTDIHGNSLSYQANIQTRNSAGVIATPPGANHKWYINCIPEDIKKSLPEVMEANQLADPRHSLNKMHDQQPFIVKLLAACVTIAKRSGSIIREIMKKGELGIVEKGINDLQTEADRSAERCIVASLHAQFPGLTVVGEEGTSSVEAADVNPDWLEMSQSDAVLAKIQDVNEDLQDVVAEDVVVWVDPLDGTSEYTQGLVDHVTTLIGIAVRGRAVAGVIHQPFYTERQGTVDAQYGRSVWGMIGVGVFGYSQNQGAEGKGNNVIVTTRSHGTGAVGEAVDACKPSDVIRAGGCGHKVLMVLEGRAHAYVFASPGCKKWDTAAPEAILQAVGGMLTDIHGNSLSYHANVQTRNSAGVIATPAGADHKWYIDHIPEDIKMSLPEVMEAKQLADPRHSLNKMHDQQPFIIKNATMNYEVDRKIQLPGFLDTSTLVITYMLPSSNKMETCRFTAYLPNNESGRNCLQLLRKAFDLGLTFKNIPDEERLGSTTLTWADIPHKENIEGGKIGNGYPDADYLERLRMILHEKGVADA